MKPLVFLALLFCAAATEAITNVADQSSPPLERLSSSSGTITGVMDGIGGDTYYAKFTNSGDDDYKVYYKITDGGKAIQEETSMVVKARSSNSNGPYHCSSNAAIDITKTEKI